MTALDAHQPTAPSSREVQPEAGTPPVEPVARVAGNAAAPRAGGAGRWSDRRSQMIAAGVCVVVLAGLTGYVGARLGRGDGAPVATAAPAGDESRVAGAPASAPAPPVDPCALLTAKDVSGVVGPMTAARSGGQCRFTPSAAGPFVGATVAVNDRTLATAAYFKVGLTAVAQAASSTLEAVADVGDEAYLLRINTAIPVTQVAVRKGNRIFSLMVFGTGDSPEGGAAAAKDLARIAADRF